MSGWPTADELQTFVGHPVDPTSANLLLSLAKAAVQAEVRQTIEAVVDDQLVIDGTGNGLILLPQLPVTAISSVVQDGTTLTEGTDYQWSSAAGYLVRLRGTPSFPLTWNEIWRWLDRLPSWGSKPRSIIVTYNHGHDAIPDSARAVVLQAATRAVENPGAVVSESVGPYRVTYAQRTGHAGGGVVLTDVEKSMLDPLRDWR